MAETSLSIRESPQGMQAMCGHATPVSLPGHANLHLNADETRQFRRLQPPIATRHRGDPSTSQRPNRFPSPAAGRCDRPLPARTPKGSCRAERKASTPNGDPANVPTTPAFAFGANAGTLPNKTSRNCPSDDDTHLGANASRLPSRTLRPRPLATWSTAGSGPEGPSPCRELPQAEIHRSSVHPNRSRPSVATGNASSPMR